VARISAAGINVVGISAAGIDVGIYGGFYVLEG
jgi:hypothetical protein